AVLENYNYKCAICDCGEKKILEAAHIIPVNSSGNDKVENGICLCRNHHRMFDEKLIELNFENHTIINIKKSVEKYVNNDKTFSKGKHESKKSST
ncbi:MAG: HNH endonuclease, partial [Clostridium sp.]|nr:HNH endonuclease [Clostridium sp.]